jgi:hypothetical protein
VFGEISADEPKTGFYRSRRKNKQTGDVDIRAGRLLVRRRRRAALPDRRAGRVGHDRARSVALCLAPADQP